jgi:DNA-binding NarL/FixJ family response regulator
VAGRTGELRVALAEDDVLLRAGLHGLLSDLDGVEVVAACGSLPELLDAVDALQPDVVLTDIRMPPTRTDEGIRAANALRTSHPSVGVVALSHYLEPDYALAMFAAGSARRGYLLKDRVDDVGRVERALRAVASGGSFLDDDVVDVLVRSRQRGLDRPIDRLTPRETDILREIATGKSNAAVAESLGVSEHAVEKHTSSIFSKLGLEQDGETHRRVAAVLLYLAADR